ncbi:hypothetical protein [Uliginosibacterium sp. H1]|uniref:hypothetical protein n=1 Tax=Uliginosibacterium sp. H1 TaxID=3114757 RepID=UPI002E19F794|nr:hypothetical protein [Uliginosibacterium sp. H1]
MHTVLDSLHELELVSTTYDGVSLTALVVELVVDGGGRVSQGSRRYVVSFPAPIAYALTEEFPASCADWIRGEDDGFLRKIDNPSLRASLGLDLEQFQGSKGYALITAHEVLVAYCGGEPVIVEQAG